MNAELEVIKSLIPHREPFLFVDRILSFDGSVLITEKHFSPNLPFYAGHYPKAPITPGVILSEAIFQSGAIFIAQTTDPLTQKDGNPVLTRILGAKYKREVFPGDTVQIHIRLIERLAKAWFMKGTLKVRGKVAVQIEFGCTLTS